MNNKTSTTIRFNENQMKILELLQDKYSNKITKPSVTDIVGFALENLLYTELDESKIFDVIELINYTDLITDKDLRNKLKEKLKDMPPEKNEPLFSIDDDIDLGFDDIDIDLGFDEEDIK